MIYWNVIDVKVISDYDLRVKFRDGLEGVVKLLPSRFRGVFEPLKDPKFFNQVKAINGAVTWPGELDLAPDAMYHEIKKNGVWVLK